MDNKAAAAVEKINDSIQKKADHVKSISSDAAAHASLAFNEAQDRNEKIKKDLESGYKRVKRDIHKTGKSISRKLK